MKWIESNIIHKKKNEDWKTFSDSVSWCQYSIIRCSFAYLNIVKCVWRHRVQLQIQMLAFLILSYDHDGDFCFVPCSQNWQSVVCYLHEGRVLLGLTWNLQCKVGQGQKAMVGTVQSVMYSVTLDQWLLLFLAIDLLSEIKRMILCVLWCPGFSTDTV